MEVILNGRKVNFDACVNMMDDEIRESVHAEIADECTEQEFLNEYARRHYDVYGDVFVI